MHKKVIPIKGMHCRSCEVLIGERISEIKGVKSVDISFKKKQAEVFSDMEISQSLIENAVIEAGYEIGGDEKEWINKNPAEYRDLFWAFIILLILYFIAKKTGLTNVSIGSVNNPSSLLIVLLIGLTAGISTCMALVGGLVLGISARHTEKHPEASVSQKFRPHLFFNLGRILSYAILGGAAGLIGKAFQLSPQILGYLIIAVGLVMLVVGLQLTEIFPKLRNISFTLPASISSFFGIKKHHGKEYSHVNSAMTGALTFFLPCGFTQAMQLYAMSTGNFWSGALIMGVFALGTAPGLLGIGGLTSFIRGRFARKFFKFAGLLVAGLALFNILNGMNLTGLSAKFSSIKPSSVTTKADGQVVKVQDGYQIVRMDQLASSYKPNKFTIQKDIPVKWIVNSKEPNSCAASLYSSKLNIRRFLKPGENIIEFIPKQTGKISFSCSMGMYSGYFEVIENSTIKQEIKPESQNQPLQNGQVQGQADKPIQAKESSLPAGTKLLKAVYTYDNDIQPNELTAEVGKLTRLEIDVKDDGAGCMSSITIPNLVDDFNILEKGKKIVFDFTPKKKGEYYINCAMGVPRGIIEVK